MAHTNSTTNYSLPQFIPTDKPAWLTDINGAFTSIDTGLNTAQTKADTAFNNAATAQGDATTAITNAAAADAKGSGAIASIEVNFDPTTVYAVGAKVMYNSLLYRCIVAVTTPGPWTGSDNWERINVDTLISSVDSKIGSLGSLATSDQSSVVNAINEVNGKTTFQTGTLSGIATVTSITRSKVWRMGRLAFVTGYISFAGNFTAGSPVATLPAGFEGADSEVFDFVATGGNLGNINCRITNGNIIANANITSGNILLFEASYFVD